ncbi:DUF1036 domain-containing protein [Myxococcus sp. MISCRS1]|uniref:DUF1036 domain-containing protein n=1 Tax=Myxococcus sp. MISCRS1 TaxID=2996786 RepID=UPI00226ED13D|nr:DUF1036 domain-containing protein [Myxococcus sp. MISCRS1]MCY1002332.1 DUF1036 domain-containing protein [Myxococcus sp. MISCRS1]
MRQPGRLSMNRRGFLRAGTLLGVGAGSGAWANGWSVASELSPTGAFGARPSIGVTAREGQLPELTALNSVNDSPGLIRQSQPPLVQERALLATERELRFRNSYGSTIWIFIAFPDPVACGGASGGHVARGWWGIGLNQEVFVLRTQASTVYYYAEADDGGLWTQTSGLSACVPQIGFNHCTENCLFGDRRLVMRPKTFGSGNLTVNLVR